MLHLTNLNSCKKKSISFSKFSLFICFILSFQLFGCSSSKYTSENDPHSKNKKNETLKFKQIKESEHLIRVLLDSGKKELVFTNPATIKVYIDGKEIALVEKENELELSIDNNSIELRISRKTFSGKSIEIYNEDNSPIPFSGKLYRGLLRFVADGNLIKTINVLDIEEYLFGVIPAEIPIKDTYYEAVKAFTICARTYAVMKLNQKSLLYDVTNNVQSQVYGGFNRELEISNRAVLETKGLILTYNSAPAIVYYSSTCGGFTEDDKNVFGSDMPYLRVVEDGEPSNCNISPSYNWTLTLTRDEIVNRLYNAGLIKSKDISIDDITIESRFESNRINELKITFIEDDEEKSVSVFGNNIRSIIKNVNNGILKSNNFEVEKSGDSYIFTGKGFGHGVGLCQYGSISLSLQGRNFEDILAHYFPGTKIETLND